MVFLTYKAKAVIVLVGFCDIYYLVYTGKNILVERYWSNNVLGETRKTLCASFRKILFGWDFILPVTSLHRLR